MHPKMDLLQKITKRQWLVAFANLFFAGIIVIIHVQLRQYAFDDAFIHFRVARNFVEMGAPYYNAHDALKVSTSSGWIIFLAMIYWIAKIIHIENNFSLLISTINAFISVCGLIVYTKVVELFLERRLTILQKLFLQTIILAILLPSSIGLMETPFALLTAGLGIYFLLRAKPLGFAFLGIAIYLRLELFIPAVLTGSMAVFQGKFKLFQILRYFILGFAPFVFFDVYYFHTIIPHSIIAKSTVFSLTPLNTLITILIQSLPQFSAISDQHLLESALFMIIVIMLCWTVFRERIIFKINYYPALLCFSSFLTLGLYILLAAGINGGESPE
jgi:hypothetical protein